jgi:hypothetical protein
MLVDPLSQKPVRVYFKFEDQPPSPVPLIPELVAVPKTHAWMLEASHVFDTLAAAMTAPSPPNYTPSPS